MAKVFQRVWRAGPRKVKRAAWGYTVQIDGKQERRFSEEWTKEDAEKELAARVLNVEQPDQRKAASAGLTLAQAAERYLAAKARKRSLFRDQAFLEHFTAEFGVNTPLSEITASRISEYRDRRLGATTTRYRDAEGRPRALSAATINRPLQVLRSLLRLARDEWEALPKVPRIRFEKEPQGRIRWLEPDEEHRLLAACQTSTRPDLHKIATVALETGMRKGEVMGLTWERVDFSRGVIRLEQTKSGKRREVPMRQAVYDTLAPLRALAAEVLPTEEEALRLVSGSVISATRRRLAAAAVRTFACRARSRRRRRGATRSHASGLFGTPTRGHVSSAAANASPSASSAAATSRDRAAR